MHAGRALFSGIDHVALGGTAAAFAALGFAPEDDVVWLENTRLELAPEGEGILSIVLVGDADPHLPFVSSVRSPAPRRRFAHPNGVYKLERVYIAVNDVATSVEQYARALGVPAPRTERGTVIHAEMAPFVFGEGVEAAALTLAQPVAPGVAADALGRRGEGPFQALFRTKSMDAAAQWLARHGVPPPARGIRNTGEQAMLVPPEHACGAYVGFVGPA